MSIAVTDVERSADFYSKLLGLKVVSRPGNGGVNLGLGTSFLGVYKLANPGTVNHFCIGVDDYEADKIAARLREMGLKPSVDLTLASIRARPTLDAHSQRIVEHDPKQHLCYLRHLRLTKSAHRWLPLLH